MNTEPQKFIYVIINQNIEEIVTFTSKAKLNLDTYSKHTFDMYDFTLGKMGYRAQEHTEQDLIEYFKDIIEIQYGYVYEFDRVVTYDEENDEDVSKLTLLSISKSDNHSLKLSHGNIVTLWEALPWVAKKIPTGLSYEIFTMLGATIDPETSSIILNGLIKEALETRAKYKY